MTPDTLPTLRAELRRQVQAAPEKASMATINVGVAEMRALLDHIDALERDARRYRWLRKEIVMGPLTIAKADSWDLHPWSGDTPDELIDAALAEQGEPK